MPKIEVVRIVGADGETINYSIRITSEDGTVKQHSLDKFSKEQIATIENIIIDIRNTASGKEIHK